MLRNYLFYLLMILGIHTVFGQEVSSVDSVVFKKGVQFHDTAFEAYQKSNIPEAIENIRKAIPFFKRSNAHGKYIEELLILSNLLRSTNQYDAYLKTAKITVSDARQLFGEQHLNYANALNNLNSYYYDKGNYNKSIELIKEVIQINESNKVAPKLLLTPFNNLANILTRIGDYPEAIQYQEKILAIHKKEKSEKPFSLIDTYNAIAWNYDLQKQVDLAKAYYDKSLHIIQSQNDIKIIAEEVRPVIRAYQGATEIALQKNQLNEARIYINKALSYQADDKAFRKSLSYELSGKIFQAYGASKKALKEFSRAEAISTLYDSKHRTSEIANRQLGLATQFDAMEMRDSALTYFEKAIAILSPGFVVSNKYTLPGPDELISLPDALNVLSGQAALHWRIYEESKDAEQLKRTLKTAEAGIKVIRTMRQGVLTMSAKNMIVEKTIPIYEMAIRSNIEKYKQEKDPSFLQTAFSFAESNKSQLLLEAMNEQAAFQTIPDSLLQKEKDLRLDIVFYQKRILEAVISQKQIEEDKNRIFDLRRELQTLTDRFEANYPRYHQLKYQNEKPTFAEWKNLLMKDQGLIEYFVGENQIYCFVLWSDGLEVVEIEYSAALFDAISQLKNSINHLPADHEVLQNYQNYVTSAHDLYQSLLKKALKIFPQSIESICIIPDAELNHIPFDLLLMQNPDDQIADFSTDQLDYVLEQYSISYDYSATWKLKSQSNKNRKHSAGLIAYAPSFQRATDVAMTRSCTSGELYNLNCSSKEVEGIQTTYGGDARMNTAASKASFEKEAARYQILHMATHACVDETNPLFNKIFLADDYLSNADLYNTSLNADLVVLSACNTGSGKLVKGEGVLSLARGFVQAGCASSIVSRWSVDDCATSDIMQSLYKELKSGRKKDAALRAAKLTYLESAGQLESHPYFWSAFVGYGDMAPLEKSGGIPWGYIFGGACLIGFFLLMRRLDR